MSNTESPFLTASWQHLLIASWVVDPQLLLPYLPDGLELDTHQGSAYVSLVAFQFRHTRVRGIAVPWHINFPEMNLRFYAKAREHRGVVFIRELVPKPAIAWVARAYYNEPYQSCPMTSRVETASEHLRATYALSSRSHEYTMRVEARHAPFLPAISSLEHALKEQDRGFGRSRAGQTWMYRVVHAPWLLYPVLTFQHTVDLGAVYGRQWAPLNGRPPSHVMFAQGSPVSVYDPRPLDALT